VDRLGVTFSRPYGTFRLSDLYPGLRPGLSSAVPAGLIAIARCSHALSRTYLPVPSALFFLRQVKTRPASLFLLLQPRVHVLLLKLLELDAVVDALQALAYGALSTRRGMLLEELSNIGAFFFGTEGS
jgi:hypothetical protein